MTPCRFQSFDEPSLQGLVASRLAALRAQLRRQGVEGVVIPRADEHQGEYVPASEARLAYVTGFTGSAGTAVVLADKAALIIDGRYTIQAAEQTDTGLISPVKLEETGAERWIEAHLPKGGRLGYDPWLHTPPQAKRLKAAAEKAGGVLVALAQNPVDAIWAGRPHRPAAPVTAHPVIFAGETAQAKMARVQANLAQAGVDALLVSDPHNLAWLFNLRGGDVSHTPLPLGYALVPATGRATLFFTPERLSPDARDGMTGLADLTAPDALPEQLRARGAQNARLRFDSATAAEALVALHEQAGGLADVGPDPIALMKARKNEVELAGARAAHLRDGAGMARFLAWLAQEALKGELTEIDAAARLEEERIATGLLKDISFPSISAAGPNAALPHYRVTTPSNRRLEPGIFLIDSGGQYEDGTTDITRTLAIGPPTPEMRDRYTRVLRGHLFISRLVFPKGTSGAQIDAFARWPLWQAGLDFDHGTGHGVGSYLSVHEGPQRISKLGATPLEPGMILSNEPGYYKPGAYGIRIENLVAVEPRAIPGGERDMLGFETLTFTPYDRRLIERSLMRLDEIAWIDAYHAQVLEKIGPLLQGAAADWLSEACAPL